MYRPYTVVDIRTENERTKSLVLDGSLDAEPGQFVMVWLPGVDARPFSVAGDAPLTLMVVAVGPFSRALHDLHRGDSLWIRGALGHGFRFPERMPGKRLLLVAGGYGVAPLQFLARRAVEAGARVDVAIGARTRTEVLLSEAFERVGADVWVTTEDGSAGERGRVTVAVERVVADRQPDVIYGCGPIPMLQALEAICKRAGLPYQLSWEARMRCGMGLCGACEVHDSTREGWLACTDGPVYIDEGVLSESSGSPEVKA